MRLDRQEKTAFYPATESDDDNIFPIYQVRNVATQDIHDALGHPSPSTMSHLKGNVTGLPNDFDATTLKDCYSCIESKSHRHPFPHGPIVIKTTAGELVHSDYVQLPETTPQGHRGFITFIDDHSRYATIYLLKNKSQSYDAYVKYSERIKNIFTKYLSKNFSFRQRWRIH
jgi:hypothetical protein